MFLLIVRLLITIVLAFLVGKLVSKIKLPAILGWLIAGMLLGPHAFSVINQEILDAGWYQILVHNIGMCGWTYDWYGTCLE